LERKKKTMPRKEKRESERREREEKSEEEIVEERILLGMYFLMVWVCRRGWRSKF
jgi:hypothetical protein